MSVDNVNAKGGADARILLIGRSPHVMESILGDLRELGLTAEGTTEPERAPSLFDAADFSLIVIGGGIPETIRAGLKESFTRRNPAIRLLDVHVTVAVRQIMDALNGNAGIARVDLDAYFARIGYDGPRDASLETLRALHVLHPDAITFEAIDVLLGRGVDISPEAVDAKLIGARRGGYCFEQNGLFKRVLEELGFKVQGLSARVRWNAAAGAPVPPRTHMALKLTIDGTSWLADVGFGGCVLTAPLRMDVEEPQATGHENFRIVAFGPNLMVQTRRNDAWLPLYELSQETQYEADYELSNWYTATHPASHFRRSLIAARTTPDARYSLRGNDFAIRRPDGGVERRTLDADEIERVLTDVFRLPVEPDWRPIIEKATAS